MKPVVASRNVICFLRPIHVSRRNDKLPVRQLLEKVSANQSPDFIVGSGIQGSPIGFFNPVIPTFTFIGVPFFYHKSAKIFRSGPIISEDVPKMLRRVPSNTNTGIQRNIEFPTKKREFGESRSSTLTFLFSLWFCFV